MYKLLLCWRYLRTRYIALASIVSVTLGVATMIVVNAVMAGFSHEMEARMHGILSDIVLEGHGLENIESPQLVMDNIQLVAGKWIAGMTPTVHVPAIITFNANGQPHSQQIMFIGIDDATYASVSDFSKYLQHPDNRKQLSFELREDGYDIRDHQLGDKSPQRVGMDQAGWKWRRIMAERLKAYAKIQSQSSNAKPSDGADSNSAIDNVRPPLRPNTGNEQTSGNASHTANSAPTNPFGPQPVVEFDPGKEQHPGVVLGIALASVRDHEGNDRFLLIPGDDVRITAPTAGDHVKGKTGSLRSSIFMKAR